METQEYKNMSNLLQQINVELNLDNTLKIDEVNRTIEFRLWNRRGEFYSYEITITYEQLKEAFERFINQLNYNLQNYDLPINEMYFKNAFGCRVPGNKKDVVFAILFVDREGDINLANEEAKDEYIEIVALALYYAKFIKRLFDNGLKTYKEELLQHQETNKQTNENQHQDTENETLLNVFKTPEAKEILQNTIDSNLCDEHYKWLHSASLWGYYVDKVSEKLNIRYSNNHIRWQPFARLFKMSDKNVSTARQKVNEYRNKGFNPPEGDDIVNEIIR